MMETASPARPKNTPSCASHNVIKTRRVNDNETFRLQEKLKVIDNRKTQKNVEIDVEKDALRKHIEKIKEVKKDAGISVDRRRHLQSLGFCILVNQKPSEEKEVKVLRRKSVAASSISSARISFQETRLTPLLTRHSESSFGLLSHLHAKLEENLSFRETKVCRFRKIQPPIRSGSKRNFIRLPKEILKAEFKESKPLVSFDPCSKLDHRGRIILPPGGTRRPSLQCGPLSPQARKMSISRSEDPNDTVKTPDSGKDCDWLKGECDDISTKVVEKANSAREPIKNQPEDIGNNRHCAKSLEEQQTDAQELSVDFDLEKRQVPKDTVGANMDMSIDTEHSHFYYVLNDPFSSPSAPVTDESHHKELSLESSIQTAPKDLEQYNFQEDQESNKLRESKHIGYESTMDRDNPKSVAWSNTVSNVFDPKETVKPDLSGIRTKKLNRPASSGGKLQSVLRTMSNSSCQNEINAKPMMHFSVNSRNYRESEGCLRTASKNQMNPDNLKHSSYPSHQNESQPITTKLAQVQKTRKVQGNNSVMMPSPPRTSPSPTQWGLVQTKCSLHSTHSFRAQSAGHSKGREETVFAYDARPDKSLNKGYTNMQITLRGRQMKVFVPKFPNETDDAMVERARARLLARTGATHLKDKSG